MFFICLFLIKNLFSICFVIFIVIMVFIFNFIGGVSGFVILFDFIIFDSIVVECGNIFVIV